MVHVFALLTCFIYVRLMVVRMYLRAAPVTSSGQLLNEPSLRWWTAQRVLRLSVVAPLLLRRVAEGCYTPSDGNGTYSRAKVVAALRSSQSTALIVPYSMHSLHLFRHFLRS